MLRKACLLCHRFYDAEGTFLEIGGVETCVRFYLKVLNQCGFEVVVFQEAKKAFKINHRKNVVVIGVPGGEKAIRLAYSRNFKDNADLTIFLTFDWAVWAGRERTIAVQHGIANDGFSSRFEGILRATHSIYSNALRLSARRKSARILDNVDKIVCVDLNFQNWVRYTFPTKRWEEKMVYIPNFAEPITDEVFFNKIKGLQYFKNVIIARRFESHRGFPLIVNIIDKVAPIYSGHNFLFAGDGKFLENVENICSKHPNVFVEKLDYEVLQSRYSQYGISIIPTLWSEGTSLSCVEALSNGMAVVATTVGGLGNLIIPEYNGLLVQPEENGILFGLERLLRDPCFCQELAYNALRTSRVFSQRSWISRVSAIIEETMSQRFHPSDENMGK
jgi:glycosyltransferase involved in cell wall biosynthesis